MTFEGRVTSLVTVEREFGKKDHVCCDSLRLIGYVCMYHAILRITKTEAIRKELANERTSERTNEK